MWHQLFGFCFGLFDVMTFDAVDGTSPLDVVILARVVQMTESNLAERCLVGEDNGFRLSCSLLQVGSVGHAKIWPSCDPFRSNIQLGDESRRDDRGKQERDLHVRFPA